MKALVFVGDGAFEIQEVASPRVGPNEVLIRSMAVGICHSDFELLEGRYIIPFTYPITPGHEWAGIVAEVGAGVDGLDPGDRVVGECVVGPGGRDHFGFNISGAAAEYFVAKAEWLHRIPDSISFTQAALVEPMSVAYNAVRCLGGVDPSDTVAVIGGGPIGLLSLLASRANNARVIVIEPQPQRRAVAAKLGAAGTLDPLEAGFDDAVAESTAGRGFDAVIEAAGAPAAMSAALRVAAHGARIAYAGISVGGLTNAELGLIQSKTLTIRGLIGSMGVWPQTIRMIASGAVDPAQIVTATVDLDRAEDAIAMARDTSTNIKVHIRTGQ